MNITSFQVLDDGTVLINGIEYSAKLDQIDPGIISALEDENAELRYRLANIQVSAFAAKLENNKLSESLAEILDVIQNESVIDGEMNSPDSGWPIQSFIDDMEPGDTLYLREGVYNEPFSVAGKDGITIASHPENTSPVEINGFRKAEWQWSDASNGALSGAWPGYDGLWTWQDNDSRGAFNNTKMYPVIACIKDEPLVWQSYGDLEPGSFRITSDPDKPGTIIVKLKEDQSIEDFQFSPYDRLFWGDESTKNITLKGNFVFEGCSNTGKTGAVNFPGSGWSTEQATITVRLVNTIGFEFGQGGVKSNMRSECVDSKFGSLLAFDCGQMGFWGTAKRCTVHWMEHVRSNWKGFDPWWEASIKLEGWEDCVIEQFVALNVNGQGFWFDISNHRNKVDNLIVYGCMLAGLMVEHYADDNEFLNIDIKNVTQAQFDPSTSWNVTAGILLQSSITRNTFDNITVDGAEDAIRINNEDFRDKNDDGTFRATTDNNTFSNLSYSNVTDPPVRVLGEMVNNKFE